MKAILMTRPGEPELLQLAELPEPSIADPGQIKVQIKAAGVNPVDTKLRRRGVFYDGALPAVLGLDGAGVVVETGAAVNRFKVGDKVWYCHGGLGREPGNYAEYTVLDARWAAPMPKSLSFEQAAAGPLVLITAWGALYDRGRLRSGQTVLIHAGAGGVGHVAVQLAKLRGARVIATVGSAEKAELATQWGADEAIDYKNEDFVAAVNDLTGGRGADLVFDTVGPEVFRRSIECTAPYGDIVTLLDIGDTPLGEARTRNLRIGFELMLLPLLRDLEDARLHQVEILEQCGRWLDQSQLRIHLSRVLPLEEAARAHVLIEGGHTSGKLVLVP
ncbi:zinc-dependent alcohol dehydrogenase family protein [Methylococcus sp. EFPC2]|uniref:zinc-dependent alcohol dehydrogenase family protein n=1 Tax=Methylococcus sp. EFPC2 TaxID=2812648 RepID=UPI001967E62C|nr:zinc-dependent alcohol dehydrogenase family protein [Methylococcus sp. EFPC2]QSA96972.1 zinc-dependent alcohol dehydrogenase family protein [Methylococcus sp. EFPC2]